jgi:soluble lytic murein transglycosylase-like protein
VLSRIRQKAAPATLPPQRGRGIADYLKTPVTSRVLKRSAPAPQTAEGTHPSIGKLEESSRPADAAKPSLQPAHGRNDASSTANPAIIPQSRKISESIHTAADAYDLPPGLIRAIIQAESGFDVRAISQDGAKGLMQLMPDTARELGVADPFDIEQNIDGGARYLRKMLDRYDGNLKLALAAYNAGPGAVDRYGGRVPPFAETRAYVQKVLKFNRQLST